MTATAPGEIAQRRASLQRAPDVAALAERLSRIATPVLEGPLYVPEQKALLSQDGGICPTDGSRLTFDPLSPDRHRCPACGAVQQGQRHHRAWIWRYHIWLSERAIHLSLLDGLGVVDGAATRAREILVAYVDRYRSYPNVDNVLGPTRLFFSTYLESIWLIQLVVAASLLDLRDDDPLREKLQAMVEESSTLIATFDEQWSNRQVWNSAALVAAGRWLGDEKLLNLGLESAHGIKALLTRAVSENGWWHEGENYHFFALRGFVLAAELMRPTESADLYRDPSSGERLTRMYLAPLTTVLPDLSVPARGDSPFAVTLLQPRFAELWEIGWARTGDASLASLLAALYGSDAPESEDTGLAEIAEVEQNRPAQRLRRCNLGWKALLWMEEQFPKADPAAWQQGSAIVESRGGGPAILRTGTDRYVSLECGGTGGGHGHPDLLHLTLYWGSPWLLDFGAGSYVAQSLHWYRSTLAHNAPGAAGVGQLRGQAWCLAFDDVGVWGWCRGVADGLLGPATRVVRSVIAGPEYVLDVVDVDARSDCVVDLPVHMLGRFELESECAVEPSGDFDTQWVFGHESGYGAVHDVRRLVPAPSRLRCTAAGKELRVFLAPRSEESCFLMEAPGPPTLALADTDRREFLVRRAAGAGRWVQLYALPAGRCARVTVANEVIQIERDDGSVEVVRLEERQAEITDATGKVVVLRGWRRAPQAPGVVEPARVHIRCELLSRPPALLDYFDTVARDTVMQLGRDDYRRSEEEYPGSAKLGARVAVSTHGNRLFVGVQVSKADLQFRAADAPDPKLDNETPDIHSDGVQCYVGWEGWRGFVAIPDAGSDALRVRPVVGTMARAGELTGSWSRTPDGYVLLLEFQISRQLVRGDTVLFNLVVNEMRPERLRRAGQLVLAGGGGWVYLRGDRESPDAAALAEVR